MDKSSDVLHVVVLGTPKGKARPRVCLRGGHAHAYTPKETAEYERTIWHAARNAMVDAGWLKVEKPTALKVEILATFSVPKSWTKKRRAGALQGVEHHVSKPDCDNITKAALDGMNGIVFEDDAQVIECRTTKAYGDIARLDIYVETVSDWRML